VSTSAGDYCIYLRVSIWACQSINPQLLHNSFLTYEAFCLSTTTSWQPKKELELAGFVVPSSVQLTGSLIHSYYISKDWEFLWAGHEDAAVLLTSTPAAREKNKNCVSFQYLNKFSYRFWDNQCSGLVGTKYITNWSLKLANLCLVSRIWIWFFFFNRKWQLFLT
jgi:hypothetical protein